MHMRHISLPFKIVYTAFVTVLVPYYWVTYTPWNFLYFCDVALLVTCVALWIESPFLISIQAVGIVLPQILWAADFLARLVFGIHATGMTRYMFDPNIPLFVRGLSSFHGWLPFVLLWLVLRLGYDRRALKVQSAVAIVLLSICYFLGPRADVLIEHPTYAVNVNYVFGLDDKQPQTLMAPLLWLILMMAFNILALYLPTHLVLKRICRPPAAPGSPAPYVGVTL